jgi:hypothetical protein
MSLTNAFLDRLAWSLLYGGLLVLMIGWWAGAATVGRILAAAGALLAIAGVAVLWWRSRRPDTPDGSPSDDTRTK